jgi:hypothetical protein
MIYKQNPQAPLFVPLLYLGLDLGKETTPFSPFVSGNGNSASGRLPITIMPVARSWSCAAWCACR